MAPIKSYDLLVIGAGIYGCWSALHACSKGLKVALVDSSDIAGATSSSSTKLLHGGLRYLEQYEFSLVRKSLSERREIKSLMPHLFRPTNFWVPVKNNRPAPPWMLKIGLWLYEHLSRNKGTVPSSQKRLTSELVQTFPELSFSEVDATFSYGDAITDDHRMALEVALSAEEKGCSLLPYHTAVVDPDGTILLRPEQGDPHKISCDQIIHCTGKKLLLEEELKGSLRLTQGTHLVLPKILQDDALLLCSPIDQRKFFLVPWYGRTLLGTTDLPLDIDRTPEVKKEEVEYLLSSLKSTTGLELNLSDVVGSFVGVRVLQGSKDAKPSEASRGWSFRSIAKNQWASIGGKYTSARTDALEMIDHIYPDRRAHSITMRGFDGAEPSDHLHSRYGRLSKNLQELIQEKPELGAQIFADLPFMWAELLHCLRHEKVTHLVDLMRRRVPLTILHPWDLEVARRATDMAAEELDWDQERAKGEFESLKSHWEGCLPF